MTEFEIKRLTKRLEEYMIRVAMHNDFEVKEKEQTK